MKSSVFGRSTWIVSLLAALSTGAALSGQTRTWVGGNGTWVDGPSNNSNWTPLGEPGSNDEAIFNTSHTATMGSSNLIRALTLSNGIDLSTEGFNLTVNGLVQLSGASTNLLIGGSSTILDADNVTINNAANLELSGGTLDVVQDGLLNGILAVNSGGTLSGNGTISLDAPNAITTLLNNNGTLSALSRPAGVLLPPPTATLTINGGTPLARIDLDGTSENGVVNVNRNQTLKVNVALADTFNGGINLFQNAKLDIAQAWSLGTGGTITVDNGAIGGIPGVPAGVSTIAGGQLTQSGGTVSVVDADGTLRFDAPFTMNGGTLTNNGLVFFNANATIGGGANFTMPTSNSSITVGAGRAVTFNQANFNPDGNGTATNMLTINSGGLLGLNLGAGGDDSLSGRFQLNGGTMNVVAADDTWSLAGIVEVGANTGMSQLSGEALTMTHVSTTIGQGSTLRVAAPLTLGPSASFTGTGTLAFNQQVTVNSPTTLNMVGGTVDLDGTDAVGDQIHVKAPLVIKAATMDSFGRTNIGGGVNVILVDASGPGATGGLTVNLDDPNAKWTLNPQGALVFLGTNAPLTMLSGSDAQLNGSVNVTGSVGTAARVDLGGTVNLLTAVPNGGFLLQGGSLNNPNTITGALINGPGALQALTGRALKGFGTINAGIDFGGTAQLIADDGTLFLGGPIYGVGSIGITDDGVLDVSMPLNTNVTDSGMVLNGGTLQGATITTDPIDSNIRMIRGKGTIHNAVVNSGVIEAQGGTLLLNNPNSDWDGTSNSGHLRASNGGTLHLVDTSGFDFSGGVYAVENSRVFTSGADINFKSGSSIVLTQGTYESTNTIDIRGSVIVGAGAPSTIKVELNRFLDFEPTSVTILNGDLKLDSNNAAISPGAAFSGPGALVIPSFRNLMARSGSDISVLIKNEGNFFPGGYVSVGRVDVRDYQQVSTGQLIVDLAGVALNQYDRLVVDGVAQINGTLNINFLGGFVPALGDTFNIISALGISGTFNQISSSPMPSGLFAKLNYFPTLVQLMIVNTPPINGDFNNDGHWNCADINALTAAIATMSGNLAFDMNGDGLVNLNDITAANMGWLAIAGAQNPAATGGNSFLRADANLDGVVDGLDFSIWNANKFASVTGWCSGNFNGDTVVDGLDFGVWNAHKFQSSDSPSAVPEPSLGLGLLSLALVLTRCVKSNRS